MARFLPARPWGRAEAQVAASESLQEEGLTWQEAEERLDDPWDIALRWAQGGR